MKIEVDGQEILIRDIKYRDKLELFGHYQDVFKPVHENSGEVKNIEFNALLGHTAEIAFANPENALKEHDYEFQLKILTACTMDYLGLSDAAKKENGG